MLPDRRTAPAIPDKWRRGLETSSPDGASNAEAEWAKEPAAVEGVEEEALNKAGLQYRKSQCWRRDLALKSGQTWQACPILLLGMFVDLTRIRPALGDKSTARRAFICDGTRRRPALVRTFICAIRGTSARQWKFVRRSLHGHHEKCRFEFD